MLKVLLPVDGSESATRATKKFIETLDWHKEPPGVDRSYSMLNWAARFSAGPQLFLVRA